MAEQSNIARWSKTAVTDVGTSLLTEFAAGRLLTITSAFGSVSDPGDNLEELTELPDGREHPLTIESVTRTDEGVTVCIQVTSLGNPEPYKLERIGIFAAAGGDGEIEEPAGREKLLMVIEDVEDENGSKGVTVPAETNQFYTFKLYAVLTVTNKERLEVSVSSAGIATMGAIEEAVRQHNEDPNAHQALALSAQGIGAHNMDPEAHPGLMARVRGIEVALNGSETITGDRAPTAETEGVKGQRYINSVTREEFVCIDVTEDSCVWELQKDTETHEDIREILTTKQDVLTGLPGQVVGFSAAGGPVPVRGWSNQNLLVNADFRNPVNRNGKTVYATTGCTIDRWFLWGIPGQVSLSGNGLLLESPSSDFFLLYQNMPGLSALLGRTLTASILYEDVCCKG